DRGRRVQTLLHASHRSLARHGCARCRRLQDRGRVARARARNDVYRRARALPRGRGRRAAALQQHRYSHRGRRAHYAGGLRSADARCAENRRRHRSADARRRGGSHARAARRHALARHAIPMRTDFDVLVVGGGLVGASLAYALRGSGLSIGVVEAFPFSFSESPSFDDRTLALAYGSRRIFAALGLWEAIARRGAAPIKRIHVSDRGRFGVARLTAAEAGLDALGYVVTHRTLGASLYEAIKDQSNVNMIAPATLQSVTLEESAARVRVQAGDAAQDLSARLLVAADGANSPIRDAVGIEVERVPYDQTAVVSAVTTELSHQDTAYERFTESGPLALLPADAERVLAWDDETFRRELQVAFGERLGRFSGVGKRNAYPLALTRVREHVRPRLALIGNAAHAVHPVAGQGFNLGLRDVAALAEVLTDAVAAGRDPGDIAALQRYADWRVR